MSTRTFVVTTQAPAGPRGRKITEKFVIVSSTHDGANHVALAFAHDDAVVTDTVEVLGVLRVSVS